MGRGSSDSISEGSGRSWWITGVVGFALFLDYLVYGAFQPLTLYSPVKLAGESQFGLLYAAYSIGLLVATPVFGYLGVRIGLKRSMICGVALLAAGVLLFWFAADFAMLFLARLLEGGAAAATWTAGLSLIATYHVKRRVEMMGYALVASTAGSILGPAAGGLLDQLGGYSLPLALMAALIAVDAILRLAVLPSRRANRHCHGAICSRTGRSWYRRRRWLWRPSDGASRSRSCRQSSAETASPRPRSGWWSPCPQLPMG